MKCKKGHFYLFLILILTVSCQIHAKAVDQYYYYLPEHQKSFIVFSHSYKDWADSSSLTVEKTGGSYQLAFISNNDAGDSWLGRKDFDQEGLVGVVKIYEIIPGDYLLTGWSVSWRENENTYLESLFGKKDRSYSASQSKAVEIPFHVKPGEILYLGSLELWPEDRDRVTGTRRVGGKGTYPIKGVKGSYVLYIEDEMERDLKIAKEKAKMLPWENSIKAILPLAIGLH